MAGFKEKMKSKNRFLKNNKLAPYDDGSDYEGHGKNKSTSWAITDNKKSLNFRSRFED